MSKAFAFMTRRASIALTDSIWVNSLGCDRAKRGFTAKAPLVAPFKSNGRASVGLGVGESSPVATHIASNLHMLAVSSDKFL